MGGFQDHTLYSGASSGEGDSSQFRTLPTRKPITRSVPQGPFTPDFSGPLSNESMQIATSNPQIQGIQPPKSEKLAAENVRLKAELKTLRNERDTGYDAMDKMLAELMAAREELEDLKSKTGGEEPEVADLRRNNKRLLLELEERDDQVMKLEKVVKSQETFVNNDEELGGLKREVVELSAQFDAKSAFKTEVSELRQKLENMTMALDEKNAQLIQKEGVLKEQELSFQTRLAEQHIKLQAEISEHQTKRAEAEANLHNINVEQGVAKQRQDDDRRLAESKISDVLVQFEAEKLKAEDCLQELQKLRNIQAEGKTEEDFQDLKASHAVELNELRRMSNFFKTNSERLSRQMKELMTKTRILEDSSQTKNKEIDEQSTLIYALKVQLQELQIYNTR